MATPTIEARNHSLRNCLLLAAVLSVLQHRYVRAEDAVDFKYQNYRESGGRIAVQVTAGSIDKDLGDLMHVHVTGVIDTITGATPTGQPEKTPGGPVPLSEIEDRRKAWNADFSRQFSEFKLTVGAGNSRESDYVSNVWSINASKDFNQKNTTVAIGVAGSGDDVKAYFQVPWARKNTLEMIAGVNQVIDPLTTVSLNLTYSHAAGYLSDQYKLVQKNIEVLPGVFLARTFGENRPDLRIKWVPLVTLNRAVPALNGAIDLTYRFDHDDFGISSHTVNLEWYQKLGSKFVLRPNFRYYVQNAADFYYKTLEGTPIVPVAVPTGKGPFYSSDYRLSSLLSYDYGIKAVWLASAAWEVDASIEKYEMEGRDGVTSASAYPKAVIITAGFKFTF